MTKSKKATKLLVLKLIINDNIMRSETSALAVKKLLLLSSCILLISGCSWGVFNKDVEVEESLGSVQNNQEEQEIEIQEEINEEMIFIAKEKDEKITAVLFDPGKREVLYEREFDYKDTLTRMGLARYDVQFDYKTKDIFLYTSGDSPYDGSCINEDKTCLKRIYKTSIVYDSAKLKKIYETDQAIHDFIVNSEEGYLVLFFYDNNKKETEIKKIDSETGEELESIVLEKSEGRFTSLNDPFISRYAYYLSDDGDASGKNNVLKLTLVDLDTKKIEEIELYRGDDSFHVDASLSPNKKLVAFYLKQEDGNNLHVYNIETKELKRIHHSTPMINSKLTWSGDSNRFTYILVDKVEFYDFEKEKKVFVQEEESSYVFEWFPSDRYLMFTNYMKGNQAWADLVIVDVLEDRQIEIKTENRKPADVSDIIGISIY